MEKLTVGFALCGSFCTIAQSVKQMDILSQKNMNIIPIMSPIVYNTDTRFYPCEKLKNDVVSICKNKIISDIVTAEPIGPKNLLDILVVSPCTGNTLAKLANGITDTCVTMAVKAHLRNNKPVVLAIATNDALGASAKNIGVLLNTKNIYFVPFAQDDPYSKNNSLISDFSMLYDTIQSALIGKQYQPIIADKKLQ